MSSSRPIVQHIKNIKELRDYAATAKSSCTGDTRFSANALLFIAERLDEIAAALAKGKPVKKRAVSEWQRFFAAGMKAGKTPAVIGEEWQKRKADRKR